MQQIVLNLESDVKEDPRLTATRQAALDAAVEILKTGGVLQVTHAEVAKATGISRSTLYRHWPDTTKLRDAAFGYVATPPIIAPKTNGPLQSDLYRMLNILKDALNDTPWGQIVPQVVAAAATDEDARRVMSEFINARVQNARKVFIAARERGEIAANAPIDLLVEQAISVPYFRKLMRHEPLDEPWLTAHVDAICRLAQGEASF